MKHQTAAKNLGKEKAKKLFDDWRAATGESGKSTVISTSQLDEHNFIKIIGEVLARYEKLNHDQIDTIKRQCDELRKIRRILSGGLDLTMAVPHLYIEQVLNDLDDLMDWFAKFHHNPTNDQIIFEMKKASERLIRRFPERGWKGDLYRCPKCLSKVDTHGITLEQVGHTCKSCHTIFYVDREKVPSES